MLQRKKDRSSAASAAQALSSIQIPEPEVSFEATTVSRWGASEAVAAI